MHFIALFTLFPWLMLALIIHKNVAFHKANEIDITRSKWLSSFIINLKPYENIWNKLSEDLGKFKITAESTEKFYDFPSNQDYRGLIKELKGENVTLQNDQHALVENYIELNAIHAKMKRSLIPK